MVVGVFVYYILQMGEIVEGGVGVLKVFEKCPYIENHKLFCHGICDKIKVLVCQVKVKNLKKGACATSFWGLVNFGVGLEERVWHDYKTISVST